MGSQQTGGLVPHTSSGTNQTKIVTFPYTPYRAYSNLVNYNT